MSQQSDTARVRELMDSVISDDDWRMVFANLLKIALSDQSHAAVAAATLLARYRWGVPVEQAPDADRAIVPIQYIEVDPNPNLRSDHAFEEDAAFAEDDPCEELAQEQLPGEQPAPAPHSSQAAAHRRPQPSAAQPSVRPAPPEPRPDRRGSPKPRYNTRLLRRL